MTGRRLSENIYITLTDHICFAVERLRTGTAYSNQLLWEIDRFYSASVAADVSFFKKVCQLIIGLVVNRVSFGTLAFVSVLFGPPLRIRTS